MMNKTLLPPSATALERKLSQAIACSPPILIRTLWDPMTCPYELLPYLAWQYSVDRWDEKWSEQTKRKVIAEAFEIHQLKGTKEAIRRAVEPFGRLINITEWWQTNSEPGTFSIDVGVSDAGITDESYDELTRIIDDVKPVSRKLVGLALHIMTVGNTTIGVSGYDGNTLSVYPYIAETVTTTSTHNYGVVIHTISKLDIYPQIKESITAKKEINVSASIHFIDTVRVKP